MTVKITDTYKWNGLLNVFYIFHILTYYTI
nr:MAG TPA: hypothetical protein [Caudoviricetes sp.]DAM50206.1 MAG TPA: hypothetical protein [Bacteriophage sp.]